VTIDQIRVAGGGSQSNAAMQLTADIFNLPVSRPHLYEASGLGAAINAAVGVGLHADYATAIKEMTRLGETFMPNRQASQIYNQLYNEVYRHMYVSPAAFL
jgi:sugar (pentulose or hexulose) kinase